MSTLEDVLTTWQNDLNFKENFRKNPLQALADANLALKPEDLTKIKIMLRIEDGKLDARINK